MDSKGVSQDARIKLRVNNFSFIMAFLGFLALVFQLLTRISPFFIIPVAIIFSFILWYFVRMLNTACPSCNKPFFTIVSFWLYATLKIKKCSKCRYSLKDS